MSRLFRYLWASPNSLLGLLIGCLSLCIGGDIRIRQGVIGFTGKLMHALFERLPNRPVAMTLGHVILARTNTDFQWTFSHELIHVRQYERWGPFFLPAYFICSLGAILRGIDPYRENPFEREAFTKASPLPQPQKDTDLP